MYADRVENGARRSVKERLNGNVINDSTRQRNITGKRQRQDDKWEHDLYEDDEPQISNRKVTAQDLRLKLQKKGLQPGAQTGKSSAPSVLDLREKLSRTVIPEPKISDPPMSKVAAKSSSKNVNVKAPAVHVNRPANPTPKRLCQKGDTSIDEFLQSLDLEKYLINFQAEEVDKTALNHMTDVDLKAMGIPMLTQFGCGSLALASHYNHCTLDGIAVRDFEVNLAALTRGEDLIIVPNADRTLLRARNPPKISHPHFEYSKSTDIENLFTVCGTNGTIVRQSMSENQTHVLYLSPQQIASLKNKAMKGSNFKNSTTFQVVAAKIWKARSIATKMPEDKVSTMLFPVDTRKRIVPELPYGFAGNALVPGFARATVRELMELEDACHIRKVQEGIERLDDEYIKSGIDWLEVNRGVPCREDSFSLVAWWRLGLEEQNFAWGRLKCATPLAVKPGLVMLLPGLPGEGGLSICLDLPEDQMQEFCRIMLEV